MTTASSIADIVAGLERAYAAPSARPGPPAGTGIFRGIILLLAPLLMSTAGQTRATQMAEASLVQLGFRDLERVTRRWNQKQSSYFVNMSAGLVEAIEKRKISSTRRTPVLRAILLRTLAQGSPEVAKQTLQQLAQDSNDADTRRFAQEAQGGAAPVGGRTDGSDRDEGCSKIGFDSPELADFIRRHNDYAKKRKIPTAGDVFATLATPRGRGLYSGSHLWVYRTNRVIVAAALIDARPSGGVGKLGTLGSAAPGYGEKLFDCLMHRLPASYERLQTTAESGAEVFWDRQAAKYPNTTVEEDDWGYKVYTFVRSRR